MATFHSSRFATAYVGTTTASVELPMISWNVNETAEMVTFRNSKTGRGTVAEQTFINVGFSVVSDFDFSANPFLNSGGGLSIVTGVTNAARLYVGGNTTPTNSAFWDFPTCILINTTHTTTVEGKPALSHNFQGSGTFLEPAS